MNRDELRNRFISLLTFGLSDDGLVEEKDLKTITPIVDKLLDLFDQQRNEILDGIFIKLRNISYHKAGNQLILYDEARDKIAELKKGEVKDEII